MHVYSAAVVATLIQGPLWRRWHRKYAYFNWKSKYIRPSYRRSINLL